MIVHKQKSVKLCKREKKREIAKITQKSMTNFECFYVIYIEHFKALDLFNDSITKKVIISSYIPNLSMEKLSANLLTICGIEFANHVYKL